MINPSPLKIQQVLDQLFLAVDDATGTAPAHDHEFAVQSGMGEIPRGEEVLAHGPTTREVSMQDEKDDRTRSEVHVDCVAPGNWLGPVPGLICLDQSGRVVEWCHLERVGGTARPARPARPAPINTRKIEIHVRRRSSRVGEINATVGLYDDVVRSVQSYSSIAVGDYRDLSIRFYAKLSSIPTCTNADTTMHWVT